MEGLGELGQEAFRHALARDAEHARLAALREIERAEERIDEREQPGGVSVETFGLRGGVPAVEDRALPDGSRVGSPSAAK